MAMDFDKIKKEFDSLLKRGLKEFPLKVVEDHFDKFTKCYETCLKLEDALEATIEGARKRGNNGTDSKGLLRDPIFKKAYKDFDKSVDEIDKAEKTAFIHTTSTAALAGNLQTLEDALEKAHPKSKEKTVVELLKQIKTKIAEMKEASDLYDVRGKHRKMREYSSKFDDKVQKIIDRGPPPEKPEEVEVPKALQPAELDKAVETAKKMSEAVVMAQKNISAILKTTVPYTAEADRKAKRYETVMDATWLKLDSFVNKIKALRKDPKLDDLHRDEKRLLDDGMDKLTKLVESAKVNKDKVDVALKSARSVAGIK